MTISAIAAMIVFKDFSAIPSYETNKDGLSPNRYKRS